MNCKLIFFVICLLILLIKVQTNNPYDPSSQIDFIDRMKLSIRTIRSFGCDGPNNINLYRCKLHCRSRDYKSGRCTKSSNFTRCICYKSFDSKP